MSTTYRVFYGLDGKWLPAGFTQDFTQFDVPDAPTNVVATAGQEQASVAFTPASTGGPATSFTVTSTPGGKTATGTGSPLVVTGLTGGVSYTFKVVATGQGGPSSESTASNSVTPTSPVVTPQDKVYTFDEGASTTTLGPDWTVSSGSTWGRTVDGKAYLVAGGDSATAIVPTGKANHRVGSKITMAPNGYLGIVASYLDATNFVWLEIQPDRGALFRKKIAGTNSEVASAVPAGTFQDGDFVEIERAGDVYRVYRNGVSVKESATGQTFLPTGQGAGLRFGSSAGSGVALRWDDFTIKA